MRRYTIWEGLADDFLRAHSKAISVECRNTEAVLVELLQIITQDVRVHDPEGHLLLQSLITKLIIVEFVSSDRRWQVWLYVVPCDNNRSWKQGQCLKVGWRVRYLGWTKWIWEKKVIKTKCKQHQQFWQKNTIYEKSWSFKICHNFKKAVTLQNEMQQIC